jgi:hypothetical protein
MFVTKRIVSLDEFIAQIERTVTGPRSARAAEFVIRILKKLHCLFLTANTDSLVHLFCLYLFELDGHHLLDKGKIIGSTYHEETLFEHIVGTIKAYIELLTETGNIEFDPVLMVAILLHDVGKPFTAKSDGEMISFSNHAVVGAALLRRLFAEVCDVFDLSAVDFERVCTYVAMHMDMHNAHYIEVTNAIVGQMAGARDLRILADARDLRILAHCDSVGACSDRVVPIAFDPNAEPIPVDHAKLIKDLFVQRRVVFYWNAVAPATALAWLNKVLTAAGIEPATVNGPEESLVQVVFFEGNRIPQTKNTARCLRIVINDVTAAPLVFKTLCNGHNIGAVGTELPHFSICAGDTAALLAICKAVICPTRDFAPRRVTPVDEIVGRGLHLSMTVINFAKLVLDEVGAIGLALVLCRLGFDSTQLVETSVGYRIAPRCKNPHPPTVGCLKDLRGAEISTALIRQEGMLARVSMPQTTEKGVLEMMELLVGSDRTFLCGKVDGSLIIITVTWNEKLTAELRERIEESGSLLARFFLARHLRIPGSPLIYLATKGSTTLGPEFESALVEAWGAQVAVPFYEGGGEMFAGAVTDIASTCYVDTCGIALELVLPERRGENGEHEELAVSYPAAAIFVLSISFCGSDGSVATIPICVSPPSVGRPLRRPPTITFVREQISAIPEYFAKWMAATEPGNMQEFVQTCVEHGINVSPGFAEDVQVEGFMVYYGPGSGQTLKLKNLWYYLAHNFGVKDLLACLSALLFGNETRAGPKLENASDYICRWFPELAKAKKLLLAMVRFVSTILPRLLVTLFSAEAIVSLPGLAAEFLPGSVQAAIARGVVKIMNVFSMLTSAAPGVLERFIEKTVGPIIAELSESPAESQHLFATFLVAVAAAKINPADLPTNFAKRWPDFGQSWAAAQLE